MKDVIARNVAISTVQGWPNQKREIASQARNDTEVRCARNDTIARKFAMTKTPVIARNVAISVVQGWPNQKREIASQARNDTEVRCARNDTIARKLANKREIASQARNPQRGL